MKAVLVLKIVFALLIMLLCCSCFSRSIPVQNMPHQDNVEFKPKIYSAKTSDGWTIVLKRFKKPDFSKEKIPIVLCHGFNYNDRFWYLDKEHSLAYYLYDRGYDVWVVALRGSGDSTKPGFAELHNLSRFDLLKLPETLSRAALAMNKLNWNIDDHINKDIPVILNLIKKETEQERTSPAIETWRGVNWIGHSLGGMIVYAYLEGGGEGINGFIPVASPMLIPQPPNDLLTIIRDQRAVMYLSLLINRTVASQFQAASAGSADSNFDLLFYNPDNMEKDMIARMYRQAVDDVSPGIIDQLRDMIAKGEFVSSDKKINYSAGLPMIDIPILCLGGLYDNLAPPMSIYFAYNNVSSKDKTIRIFCTANGYSANYGHNDLLLGKKAAREVYPFILKWLEERSAKPDRPSPAR